jgi:hypothetical protein
MDCLRMMTSEGAYGHYYHGMVLGDEPWVEMDIYDTIRGRWCELMNAKMRAETDAMKRK